MAFIKVAGMIRGFIKVAPNVEISNEALLRLESIFNMPGEHVRVTGKRFAGETPGETQARLSLTGNGVLTVSEVVVMPLQGRGPEAVQACYGFDGVPGLHNVAGFGDPRGDLHLYGVLLNHDGKTWFTEMDGVDENSVPKGVPRRILPQLDRLARTALAVGGPDAIFADDAEFFTSLDKSSTSGHGGPLSGEFVLHPNADGTCDLGEAPWMSCVSADEEMMCRDVVSALGLPEAAAAPVTP